MAVDDLAARGFDAIVAHPERHADEEIAARLRALVDRGALVQVTAEYLVRSETAPLLLELAESGLVHLIASDAHSSRAGRPLRLSEGFERLRAVDALRDHLEWIAWTGPYGIVSGAEASPAF